MKISDLANQLISKFQKGKRFQLPLEVPYQVIDLAEKLFQQQPIFLELMTPVNICGDIHGQYSDLLRLFKKGGYPPHCNYLFLGDYVDRGFNSLETICLLYVLKILYPHQFFLLRGNHESMSINKIYGFYEELVERYPENNQGVNLWKRFNQCFNYMPVAALVDDSILCMHGGISPELTSLDQIRNIPRPVEIPEQGLLCDLVWSDPEGLTRGWGPNDRGVSYTFGADTVDKFLKDMNLELICRAHQVVEDGYEFFCNRQLVTVFSAPNYCGEFDNSGGMLTVNRDLLCSFVVIPPESELTISKSLAGRPPTPPPM